MKKSKLLSVAVMMAFGMSSLVSSGNVDTKKSSLKWSGAKVTGEHYGYIQLKSGNMEFEDNKIVSGVFKIDMTSITNEDLEDPKWNKRLVDHLKSDDFFSVDNYPESILKIHETKHINRDKFKVSGDLTIKGITHPVSFEAQKSGNKYQASIDVDRTKYDIKFRSGKFFSDLGDNLIYDKFTLDVMIYMND